MSKGLSEPVWKRLPDHALCGQDIGNHFGNLETRVAVYASFDQDDYDRHVTTFRRLLVQTPRGFHDLKYEPDGVPTRQGRADYSWGRMSKLPYDGHSREPEWARGHTEASWRWSYWLARTAALELGWPESMRKSHVEPTGTCIWAVYENGRVRR